MTVQWSGIGSQRYFPPILTTFPVPPVFVENPEPCRSFIQMHAWPAPSQVESHWARTPHAMLANRATAMRHKVSHCNSSRCATWMCKRVPPARLPRFGRTRVTITFPSMASTIATSTSKLHRIASPEFTLLGRRCDRRWDASLHSEDRAHRAKGLARRIFSCHRAREAWA